MQDPRADKFTRLFWTSIGVLFLGMGLFAFKLTVHAWLAGQQYAGSAFRRQMSNLVSPDVGVIISLLMAIAGAATIYAGICQTFPALEKRRWFRWTAALVFGVLLLLLLSLGVLVVAERLFRL